MNSIKFTTVKRVCPLITVLLLLAGLCQGQGNLRSARQLALGRSFVALPGGSWNLLGNPALMETQPADYSVHFSGIRNFGLKTMQEAAGVATGSRPFGSLGIGLHHFGGNLYRELLFATGYSGRLDRLYFGFRTTYTHVSIQRYGSDGAVGLDLGSAVKIGSRTWLGALAANLNRPTLGEDAVELPPVMALGLSHEWSDGSLVTTEVVKSLRFPIAWRGGIEVQVVGPLQLRLGALTRPTAWTAGIGLSLHGIRIDLGVERHQALGLSYGAGMGLIGGAD